MADWIGVSAQARHSDLDCNLPTLEGHQLRRGGQGPAGPAAASGSSRVEVMINLSRDSFERLVQQALDDLPDEFAERLENVAVVVEDEPDPEDLEAMGLDPEEDADELFGLYHGVPLIERDSSYSSLPDRVIIYMGPILRACRSPREVVREVRNTVVHELGHHFGLSDEEMPY